MSPGAEPLPTPPTEIAGIRVGDRVRTAGPVVIHSGEDALGLPVRVYFAREDALDGADGNDGADTFLRAVGVAARAQHPSLVAFTTGGRKDGLVYAVSKDAGGRTVDELIGRGGALAAERALAIAADVAAALAALEEAGTRHGDLTPRRIQLPGRGKVAVRPPRVLPPRLYPRKARYQAPEESRGGDGDIRSDLFVLGLILIEMLSGRSPLPGGSAAATALGAWTPPDIPALAPATPAQLVPVLARLLAPEPGDRFATAAGARDALAAVARGETPTLPPLAPAAAPIPTAAPLDDDRPETAPISAAEVRAAREAAGVAPPASTQQRTPPPAAVVGAPAPARAAQAPPTAGLGKREPGRVYVQARLGEALLEIVAPTWIGWPEGMLDVQARPEAFDGAVLRVEPGDEGDVLHAATDDVRVNGDVVTTTTLEHGDTIAATRIEARYERTARIAVRASRLDTAPRKKTAALLVLGITVVATLGVVSAALVQAAGIGRVEDAAHMAKARADQALRDARMRDGETRSGSGAPQAPERAAQTAYEDARAVARSNPDTPDIGRLALSRVAERHANTAFGRLAAAEAAAIGAPESESGADAVLETLLESAEADAITGGLDDALVRLRNYADRHGGTIAGATVERTMLRLQAEMDARLAADEEKIAAAMAAGDLRTVLQVTRRALEYVPWSRRDTFVKARDEAKRRMEAVLGGGGTTVGGVPPQQQPDTGPTDPGPDVTGPVTPPVEPDQPDPPGPGADDATAQTLFQDARRAMSAGHDAEALELFVELLREHKGTPTVERVDQEVRGRIRALADGPAEIVNAFRGKVEERDRGRWRITYDLSDPYQLDDFRDINAFEAPPRAQWSQRGGKIGARGSGAYVLDAAFESEFLTVQVEVQPERAHDLGVIMFEPGNQQRYYLYTIQNSFFRLGAGDGREEFREHAVVLFGPDMWADTPEGEIGFVRKCGSREPRIPPGQPVTIKCGKADDQVWMRFPGGRTIRGSAYGDAKYEFKGLMPGVFLINSAGAFGSLVIEGVPDAAWVANHWEKVLEEL